MTHKKKFNQFDLWMGIGVILMIVLGIALAITPNKAQALSDIPTMEYNHELDSLPKDTVIGTPIEIYPEGVVDFIYQDGMWLIEYSDDDAFDMDRLANEDEAYQYCHYIVIECTQETFFDYLKWYSQISDTMSDEEYDHNHGYYIREVVTNVPGGKNYRYYLCK